MRTAAFGSEPDKSVSPATRDSAHRLPAGLHKDHTCADLEACGDRWRLLEALRKLTYYAYELEHAVYGEYVDGPEVTHANSLLVEDDE